VAKETLKLELDAGLVERVRRYSRAHGRDVAETISGLIASLPPAVAAENGTPPAAVRAGRSGEDEEWVRALPPLTRSLYGIAAGEIGEADYKEYLWQKYGP
jgi:hypothetical protein